MKLFFIVVLIATAVAEDSAEDFSATDRTEDAPCFACARETEVAFLAAADGEKRCAAFGTAKECLAKEESAKCRERIAGRELLDRIAGRCGAANCGDVCPKASKCANCVKEFLTLRRAAREKFEAKRAELGDANFDKATVVAEFKSVFCTAAARLFTNCRDEAAATTDGGDGRPCTAVMQYFCAYKSLCTDTPCERRTNDISNDNAAVNTDPVAEADVVTLRSKLVRYLLHKARKVRENGVDDTFEVRRENRAKNEDIANELKEEFERVRQTKLDLKVTDGENADMASLEVTYRQGATTAASGTGVLAASFALLALVLALF